MRLLLSILITTVSLLCNAQLEIPYPYVNCQVIKHQYYTLCYNEQHEQASWVAYSLSTEMLSGTSQRKDNFRPDPDVSTGSAQLVDYKGTSYDRGHLVPAADMKVNTTAMNESFYLSNMSPQVPGFNRGIWRELEQLIRNRARFHTKNGTKFYIVTGPILRDGLPSIGPNKVSIPVYYYKVIYDPYIEDQYAGIAFLMKNESSDLKPSDPSFLVSIDSIETLTGIDFFPELDDVRENEIEANTTWRTFPTGGTLMQNMPKYSNNYVSGRCHATTKAGTQCKRKLEDGRNHCWQH